MANELAVWPDGNEKLCGASIKMLNSGIILNGRGLAITFFKHKFVMRKQSPIDNKATIPIFLVFLKKSIRIADASQNQPSSPKKVINFQITVKKSFR